MILKIKIKGDCMEQMIIEIKGVTFRPNGFMGNFDYKYFFHYTRYFFI
jgi:hypothetical protein